MSIEDNLKKLFKRTFNPIGKEYVNLENDIIDELILQNGIELSAMSPEGQPLYTFTPKIKELLPELYEEHLKIVNKEIMNLWEKGFLSINFLEDDPSITLTDKAFDNEAIFSLSMEEQWSLNEAKRLMRR